MGLRPSVLVSPSVWLENNSRYSCILQIPTFATSLDPPSGLQPTLSLCALIRHPEPLYSKHAEPHILPQDMYLTDQTVGGNLKSMHSTNIGSVVETVSGAM